MNIKRKKEIKKIFFCLFITISLCFCLLAPLTQATDTENPTYTNLDHSGETGGEIANFSFYADDNSELYSFIFSYKYGVGSYSNATEALFSSTPGWGNFSMYLPAQNTTFYFKFFFRDIVNNWNVTSEESFSVTYVEPEPSPTPTPTPTSTPTATPTASPTSTPSIKMGNSQNLYFRSDSYTTLNVTANGLDADFSSNSTESSTLTDIDQAQFGFKVYLVTSDTQETELTVDVSAIITVSTNTTGFTYGYWTMPQTNVILGYQALKVELYSNTPSYPTWQLRNTFITPLLITTRIYESTLTFKLYVNASFVSPSVMGGTTDYNMTYFFGSIDYKSGVFGLSLRVPLPSEVQLWRLSQGDYVGFEIGAYTDIIGEVFYVLLLVLFAGVLYFRYGHFGVVAFFFTLFGGIGGLVWFFVPLWVAVPVAALVIIGTSFIVWRLIR